jgi:hypothetical protein
MNQAIRRRTKVRPCLWRHGYPRTTNSINHYVGIGKQTVKGTAVAPTVFAPFQGAVDLDHGMDGEDVRQAGTGPYVNRTMKTAHDPAGGFGQAWRPQTLARLMAWFLGADAVAASGSLWDHTATPAETNTWLTLEQGAGVTGDIIERFTDALITSMSISGEGNTDLMAELGWTALSPGWQSTAATPTYETGVSGSTPGGPYRLTEASYTIDGSAATNVQSFSIDLEWAVDGPRLSKVTRADLIKTELSGKVKLKQMITDATAMNEYRKVVYGSTTGTAADKNFFQGGSLTIAFDNGLTTTNQRTVSVQLPVIDWKMSAYTAISADGETMYIEREGTVRKGAGAFCTVVSKTADNTAY